MAARRLLPTRFSDEEVQAADDAVNYLRTTGNNPITKRPWSRDSFIRASVAAQSKRVLEAKAAKERKV